MSPTPYERELSALVSSVSRDFRIGCAVSFVIGVALGVFL